MIFTAIDFETADYYRDSACSVALVRVEDGAIVDEVQRLIRPPRRRFVFTYIHGITWPDVQDAPPFAQVWPELARLTEGADFLAAHNASFDRSVLETCCGAADLAPPPAPWRCTVDLARATWGIFPTKLNCVCEQLKIPLQHHDALSDARACAKILLAAAAQG